MIFFQSRITWKMTVEGLSWVAGGSVKAKMTYHAITPKPGKVSTNVGLGHFDVPDTIVEGMHVLLLWGLKICLY